MRLLSSKQVAGNVPPIFNAALSNVKGLPFPVYSAGAKMVASYPVSIVAHGLSLNITVTSYLDKIDIGVLACAKAMADPQVLADLMEHEFALLKKATTGEDTREQEAKPKLTIAA